MVEASLARTVLVFALLAAALICPATSRADDAALTARLQAVADAYVKERGPIEGLSGAALEVDRGAGRPIISVFAGDDGLPDAKPIGPDKKVKLTLTYPMSTGRNFDEILRAVDSLQLTAKHKVSTPVNWKPGEDVIISGSVSDEEAKKVWPEGWRSPKPYIRIAKQPR